MQLCDYIERARITPLVSRGGASDFMTKLSSYLRHVVPQWMLAIDSDMSYNITRQAVQLRTDHAVPLALSAGGIKHLQSGMMLARPGPLARC